MNKITIRLKKIQGQISGLIDLINQDDDCEKIIIQFQAVKAAMESAFSYNLEQNLGSCLRKKDTRGTKRILNLISKK